jgi:hypothetical protein
MKRWQPRHWSIVPARPRPKSTNLCNGTIAGIKNKHDVSSKRVRKTRAIKVYESRTQRRSLHIADVTWDKRTINSTMTLKTMHNNSNVTSLSRESPIRSFNGTQAFHYLSKWKVGPAVPTISIMRGTGSVTRNWTTYRNHYIIQAFPNLELQNHFYCNDVHLISATCDAFSVPLQARRTPPRTYSGL